jgi:hypothetical protein
MAQTRRNLTFNYTRVRTGHNGCLNMARHHWCSFKAGFLLTTWVIKQVFTKRTPSWSYFQLPYAISLEEGTFVATECRQQPAHLGLHVNWTTYLPSFNRISTSSTDLHKSPPHIKFHEIPSSGSRADMGRRTKMKKLHICSHANTPTYHSYNRSVQNGKPPYLETQSCILSWLRHIYGLIPCGCEG